MAVEKVRLAVAHDLLDEPRDSLEEPLAAVIAGDVVEDLDRHRGLSLADARAVLGQAAEQRLRLVLSTDIDPRRAALARGEVDERGEQEQRPGREGGDDPPATARGGPGVGWRH